MLDVVTTGSVSTNRNWNIPAAVFAGMTLISSQSGLANEAGLIESRVQYSKPNLNDWTSNGTTSDNKNADSYLRGLEVPAASPSWYFEVAQRIAELSVKSNGWKGAESAPMLNGVRKNALYFLNKLEMEGVDRRPSVGLDFEGTISFIWMDDDLKADLTIYDDGTYSYFASGEALSALSDEASLANPLDGNLLSLLLS